MEGSFESMKDFHLSWRIVSIGGEKKWDLNLME